MKFNTKTTAVCGLLATFALTSLTPVLASPSSRQSNKNQWRNLGIAGAAIAGYGLLQHNQTATLLGAAGAAYSANRYEQDRHSQSQNNDWRTRYHRSYDWNYDGNQNTRYGQNSYDNAYGSSYGSDNNSCHRDADRDQGHDRDRDRE